MNDLELFGFAVEPHKNNYYVVSPATYINGDVTCHDLGGFMGSWKMKDGGVFFLSESGDAVCTKTLEVANQYAKEKNSGEN